MPQTLEQTRAGISLPLTNLAQGVIQSEFVMRLLFPLAETATYGGTTLQFDDSTYEEVDDDRADDTPYPEIDWGYSGKPYKLSTKGLSWRLGDKRRNEFENVKINWGQTATDILMGRAMLKHEVEASVLATTVGNYATANRVTLSGTSQWNDTSADPDPVIRAGKSVVASQCGKEPNVAILGRDVFDALATKYARNFTSTGTSPGLRQQLTLETVASIFGFQKVGICDAIVKRAGVRQKLFGKHMVMGVSNPAGLNANLPYRPDASINSIIPAYGYTYVMQGHPLMYKPHRDEDRKATVFQLDFDRRTVLTGVDESGKITYGYLIASAVA